MSCINILSLSDLHSIIIFLLLFTALAVLRAAAEGKEELAAEHSQGKSATLLLHGSQGAPLVLTGIEPEKENG